MNRSERTSQTQFNSTKDIFVGGLPSETTECSLRSYFSRFGKLRKCHPQRWKSGAKKCRGFAIITCESMGTYNTILSKKNHWFKGRLIDCKPTLHKEELKKYNKTLAKRKIFVKDIPSHIKDLDLTNIFSQFGEVEIAYIIKRGKHNFKNAKQMGFVTFRYLKSRNSALEHKKIFVDQEMISIYPYLSAGFEKRKQANPGRLAPQHMVSGRNRGNSENRAYANDQTNQFFKSSNTNHYGHQINYQISRNNYSQRNKERKLNNKFKVFNEKHNYKARYPEHIDISRKERSLGFYNPESVYKNTKPTNSSWFLPFIQEGYPYNSEESNLKLNLSKNLL